MFRTLSILRKISLLLLSCLIINNVSAQPPFISGYAPKSGRPGTVVTINGSNLINPSGPNFLGGLVFLGYGGPYFAMLASPFITSTQISATVEPGNQSGFLWIDINGHDYSFPMDTFIVINPIISSISPAAATSGMTINIKGKYFTGSSSVSFGVENASAFTVISDSLIQATVGSGSSGYVSVVDSGGTGTIAGFTYYGTPVITAFTPQQAGSGDTVTIKGSSFTGATAVSFGATPASSFAVISDSVIEAVVGSGNSGNVSVTVPLGGTSVDSGFVFFSLDSLCPPTGNETVSSSISGTSYQWQLNSGSGYTDISDNSNYSGTNGASLQLTNIPSSWTGYQYRCMVDGNNSNVYTLKFTDAWTGAVNNTWEIPGNWGCGVLPDTNTDVSIPSGIVMINSNVLIKSLELSPAVSLTVTSGYNLTVTH